MKKSYIVFKGNGTFDFKEKEVPLPMEGQLLIRTGANALCGSERGQFYNGSSVTPGHEATGRVEMAGKGTKIKKGTKGVIFLMGYCGKCTSCQKGYTNQCLDKKTDVGFNRDGGYGPYIIIDERWFFPIEDNVTSSNATLLLDIMGTGGHAIKRAGLVRSDINSVAISGGGPIGLGVLAMSKIILGKDAPVFVSESIPYRLDLIKQLEGIPVNLKESTLEKTVKDSLGYGTDISVDTSGKLLGRQACLNSLAKRGVLVCVGHGENLDINVSSDLIGPERAVLGSEYFAFKEFSENYELFKKNEKYLSQIITHRFELKDISKAFELFFSGNSGKVIIVQEE